MEERGNDARVAPRRKVLEVFTARFYDYGYQDVSSRFKKRLLQQHTRGLASHGIVCILPKSNLSEI